MTAGRKINSQSRDWGTPLHYVEAVRSVFGGKISLDPCSNKHSIVKAETEYQLPKIDGLNASWNFPTIYVNPPYGADPERGTRIRDWLKCCAEAHDNYYSEILALVPVATNTLHWKRHIWDRATAICFLYDTRLKFLVNGRTGGKGAPMSCAMVYWGNKFNSFTEVFSKYGAIIDLRRSQVLKVKISKSQRQKSLFEEIEIARQNAVRRVATRR